MQPNKTCHLLQIFVAPIFKKITILQVCSKKEGKIPCKGGEIDSNKLKHKALVLTRRISVSIVAHTHNII